MKPVISSFILWLTRPHLLFWILPFLMGLLIAGTLAQRDVGIYAAQQAYFSAPFVLMGGWVPFPGGVTLISLLFLSLLAKFLFKSQWSWEKAGIILTHFGALLLLAGGVFTFLTAKEGFILIPEGESRAAVQDYHQRELKISRNGEVVFTRPHQALKDGLTITDPTLPFRITLDQYCFSCDITMRPEAEQESWTEGHLGARMKLNDGAVKKEEEANLTGIEFTLSGSNESGVDGKYLTFDGFPKPPTFNIGKDAWKIEVARAERPLPFTLTLTNFRRDFHPGTMMARAYRSELVITDGPASWPVVIEMNEPLRYRGYTFYQSSFDESGEVPYTILSVVENTGRLFPYIASIVMALGLLLHLILRLARKKGAAA